MSSIFNCFQGIREDKFGYTSRRRSRRGSQQSDVDVINSTNTSSLQPVASTSPSSPSRLVQPFPKCLQKPPSNNALGLYMDNLPDFPSSVVSSAYKHPRGSQTTLGSSLPSLPKQRHIPLICQMNQYQRPMAYHRHSGASFMTSGSATSVLLPPSVIPAGLPPPPSPVHAQRPTQNRPSTPRVSSLQAFGSVQIGVASQEADQSPWSACHHVPVTMLL